MNTVTQPKVLSPTVIVLALLGIAVMYLGLSGTQIMLFSNLLVDIILVGIIGMAICAMGGIGRVAARKEWSHPLSIIGYILGALILVIGFGVFLRWNLPFITSDRAALTAIGLLAAGKVVLSVIHSRLENN
jgi:hypothetical protein